MHQKPVNAAVPVQEWVYEHESKCAGRSNGTRYEPEGPSQMQSPPATIRGDLPGTSLACTSWFLHPTVSSPEDAPTALVVPLLSFLLAPETSPLQSPLQIFDLLFDFTSALVCGKEYIGRILLLSFLLALRFAKAG